MFFVRTIGCAADSIIVNVRCRSISTHQSIERHHKVSNQFIVISLDSQLERSFEDDLVSRMVETTVKVFDQLFSRPGPRVLHPFDREVFQEFVRFKLNEQVQELIVFTLEQLIKQYFRR